MNNNWFHNYGWSIIAATVIINLFLFPLKLANLKSMRKMQSLQPEIAKINEKYKNAADARSQAGGQKCRDDGAVFEGRDQPDVGLHPDADSDALPVRFL